MAVLTLKDSTSYTEYGPMDRAMVTGSTLHVQKTGLDLVAISWDGAHLNEISRAGITDGLEKFYAYSNASIICKTGSYPNLFLRRFTFNGSVYIPVNFYDWAAGIGVDDTTLDYIAMDNSYVYVTGSDPGDPPRIFLKAFSLSPLEPIVGADIGIGPAPGYEYATYSICVGNYIYVLTATDLRAYSFDGAAFHEVGSPYVLLGASNTAFKVWSDGTYIFVVTTDTGSGNPGVLTFTFNGSAFTLGPILTPDGGRGSSDVWSAGGYAFVPHSIFDGSGGLQVHQRGSSSYTFKEEDALPVTPPQDALAISGMGNLLFVTSNYPTGTGGVYPGRIWTYQFEPVTSSVTRLDTRFLKISSTAPGIEDDGVHALRIKVKPTGGVILDGDGLSVDKSQINEFKIIEHVLSSSEITAKQFTLLTPIANTDQVDMVVLGGLPLDYGADYTAVSSTIIGWSGLGIDGTVAENDEVRVIYSV